MNIKQLALQTKKNLECSITQYEEMLKDMPEGTLICNRTSKRFNWYCKHPDGDRSYIVKENLSQAESLALKGLLQAALRDEKQELEAINKYLQVSGENRRAIKYLERNSEYRRLAGQAIENFGRELAMNNNKDALSKVDPNAINVWLQDKYIGARPQPESLRYMSQGGFHVRSKSEQMIVSLLVKYGIPFKYEHPLFIDGHNYFPDFTIMHPETHEIYIWEHLGMMDDINYLNKNLEKLKKYRLAGFVPGEKLILTFETSRSGMDEVVADFMMHHFFL